MKTRSKYCVLSLSIVILVSLLTTSLQAARVYTKIVDDSFADGDFAKTGALDTPWWTSSSSSGKEISVGSLGLVTGTSGRGIHTIFPTQDLEIGEGIRATYTFKTPATINTGGGTSAAFRVGFHDDLGQAGLNADVSASSGTPNDLYGYGSLVGGPGTPALPGYMLDMDVNGGATADINFREHLVGTLFGTGRLMATTTNYSNISPSGPDAGYNFDPNTTYTGSFEIIRVSATEMKLKGSLDAASHFVKDAFDSNSFSMFGFHVNSNKFGSSSTAGDPDNGIDFSNIMIETSIPEPSSIVLLMGAIVSLVGRGRRR